MRKLLFHIFQSLQLSPSEFCSRIDCSLSSFRFPRGRPFFRHCHFLWYQFFKLQRLIHFQFSPVVPYAFVANRALRPALCSVDPSIRFSANITIPLNPNQNTYYPSLLFNKFLRVKSANSLLAKVWWFQNIQPRLSGSVTCSYIATLLLE